MKTLVIPDVHGRYDLLKLALDNYPEHHYVFLGDLIDRGENSRGCLQLALELQKKGKADLILGNHEYMAWMAYTYPDRYDWWLGHGGKQTLASYSSEVDFKNDLTAFLGVADHFIIKEHFLFSHAGIPAIFNGQVLGEDHLWQGPNTGIFHTAPEDVTHSFHGHTVMGKPKIIRPDGLTSRYYLDTGMRSLAVLDLESMDIGVYNITS